MAEQKFRNLSGATKNSGVKPNAANPGNIKWDRDSLVDITYKIAPAVYSKYDWKNLKYSIEDFTQDAVMYIMDLYDRDYLDLTLNNIGPLINRMLNGHFVYNMYKKHQKHSKEYSLNKTKDTESSSQEFIDDLKDESPDSEVLLLGEDFLKAFIDNLSFIPYSTRKYKYKGYTDKSGEIELTESNLAKLIISGYTLHQILKIFNVDTNNIGASSQASYIAYKVRNIINKLALLINNEEPNIREAIKLYLKSANTLEPLI